MAYKARPGFVLLNICDAHLLVATRPLWAEFPRIRPLPNAWAVCWTLMEKGKTDQDVINMFMRLFNAPEAAMHKRFDPIFSGLAEEGYLIPVEEDAP